MFFEAALSMVQEDVVLCRSKIVVVRSLIQPVHYQIIDNCEYIKNISANTRGDGYGNPPAHVYEEGK